MAEILDLNCSSKCIRISLLTHILGIRLCEQPFIIFQNWFDGYSGFDGL